MFYRTSVDMCRSALSRRLRPTSERLQRRTVRQKTFGRRFRQRRPDALVEIKDGKDGVVKRCSNVACRDVYPVCVAEASYRCSKGNVSSRWHHISTDEHLCQACYEYYTCKDGLQPVRQWRRRWKSGGGKNQPSVKNFIAEEVLPYWVQCRLCNKWRQVTSISPEVIQTFRCESSVAENGEINQCTVVENPVVKHPLSANWYQHLSTPVMVKNSPAGRFLANEYYCDLVGMSPTSRLDDWRTAYPMSEELEEVMQPFYLPNDYGRALSCRPDAMDSQELEEFPEYKSDQTLYLSVRNLVIALWSINPKEWVTPEKCSQFLICRGLVRILLVHETDRILRYLTVKGLVNFGILPSPPEFFTRTASKLSVLIIGAGISGLTAARHLQNLGAEVMILESKGEIGGRICDTHHMGTVVGKGGQLITGIVNNPFAVMCVQAGLKYRPLSDACPLFCSDGNLVDAYADKKVEFHFNSLLDAVEFYRSKAKVDSNLLDLLMEIHDTYLEENGTKFNTVTIHLTAALIAIAVVVDYY